MTKEEILAEASRIISRDRNLSHGDAYKNHADIAEYWNIFLDDKLKPMANITPSDVALMMILLKISRRNKGVKFNIAGYAAIAGEIDDSGSF